MGQEGGALAAATGKMLLLVLLFVFGRFFVFQPQGLREKGSSAWGAAAVAAAFIYFFPFSPPRAKGKKAALPKRLLLLLLFYFSPQGPGGKCKVPNSHWNP